MEKTARRFFIALPVHDEKSVYSLNRVSGYLEKNYSSLLKVVPPENFHLTLKFFGSVDPESAQGIIDSFLSLGRLKKTDFKIEGIGAFPSAETASVIWAGLNCDEKPLKSIFQSVENLALSCGFPPEKRKFVPHLTLARVRRDKKIPSGLINFLNNEKHTFFNSSVFSELILFESILKNTGAEYKKIEELKLI